MTVSSPRAAKVEPRFARRFSESRRDAATLGQVWLSSHVRLRVSGPCCKMCVTTAG